MSKRIDAHTHSETRLNIPTGEMEAFIQPEDRDPIQVEIERRDTEFDPQLVWRGKAEGKTLTVTAPPIYVQEQVHPKALIEDLRAEREQADDLFAHFGVEEDLEAEVEFYSHPMPWSNRMILGDAMQVMTSLAEREGLRGKVQAIYIDPPYGIRFNSNFQWTTTDPKKTKDGRLDSFTREPEQIKAFRDTWRDEIHSYLSYLRDRLEAAKLLLSESGSCFVQIGDENVHRVRALMDEVFGDRNFVSDIVLKTTSGAGSPSGGTLTLAGVYDVVIWYAIDKERVKYHQLYFEKVDMQSANLYKKITDYSGKFRSATSEELAGDKELEEGAGLFRPDNLTSQSSPDSATFEVSYNGNAAGPGKGGWKTNTTGMSRLKAATRIFTTSNATFQYLRRLDDFNVAPINNVWTDVGTGSFTADKVFIVQTNTKIIQRCLLMTTDPGDLVLDPTCGSGTTAFVAEQWGRRWITIDTSRVALALARARIMGAKYPYYLLSDSEEGQAKEAELTHRPPAPGPFSHDLRHGFVYHRVPHITLKSIANNPEIDDIWEKRQPAIVAALEALNVSLRGHAHPFEVTSGGRAGDTIEFGSNAEPLTLPSGETAPKNGFLEWEVPREPGTPWPSEQLKWLETARKQTKKGAPTKAAREALKKLNFARGTNFTQKTLPNRGVEPWHEEAEAALAVFWKARITRQKEIDESIAARAESEMLYDRPYEDDSRIRVAGPFTVETLSPHRTPPVGPDGELLPDDPPPGEAFADAPEGERDAFFRAILDNLKAAGVNQLAKDDKIEFTSVNPWPGRFIGAVGHYLEGETERRAAILVGPEYGSVQNHDLEAAGREAAEAGFDILVACAFNYDAHADLDRVGDMPVLRARMNPDLHMAGDLQAGGGNLFVVFGEPDVVLHEKGDELQVEIRGVDVFRPQSGEVDCTGPEGIACWFVDTDYTGDSFFVRHAYFLGAGDPYKALRTTLKDEIDKEAWESLNSAISRPFPRPEGRKIAVKAINHLGDEVMRVFDV